VLDLSHSVDNDDDLPDVDDSAAAASTKPTKASDVLPSLALDAALSARNRRLLKQRPSLLIIKVPAAAWVTSIVHAIRQQDLALHICAATDLSRSGGKFVRPGADHLSHLEAGASVVYVSQAPQEIFDEVVLAAADATVEIVVPTPARLRRAIRMVTGGMARGVTAEMAALDLQILLSAIRPGMTGGECVAKLREAVVRNSSTALPTGPALTELPLTPSVRIATDLLLADLRAVKDGSMPPGQLLYPVLDGPPGTGKTLIAESLARSAGWAFVPATVGGWFTTGDGALGGVAKNLRAFADEVLSRAPAIGFLDEIDALPDRATMDNRSREWWTPVITLFLTEIDRLRKSGKPLLLIGATNYYAHLDAALVRPGRLQQRIPVYPPQNEDELLELLRYCLGSDLGDANLTKLARLSVGATPAMVEGWVKVARATARIAGRPMLLADLVGQVLPPDGRSEADIRTVALHEVGHAVVAHRLGLDVDRVSILPEGQSGGHTRARLPSIVPTWPKIRDLVTVSLGGRAADMVLSGAANAGAENDLATATSMLVAALERQGLGDDLAHGPELGSRRAGVAKAVEEQLGLLLQRAVGILRTDRAAAVVLAERLVVERLLSGTDVAKVLSEPVAKAASRRKARTSSIQDLDQRDDRLPT
jgi:cell division protease FtsH